MLAVYIVVLLAFYLRSEYVFHSNIIVQVYPLVEYYHNVSVVPVFPKLSRAIAFIVVGCFCRRRQLYLLSLVVFIVVVFVVVGCILLCLILNTLEKLAPRMIRDLLWRCSSGIGASCNAD